jgi:hypothetical protein
MACHEAAEEGDESSCCCEGVAEEPASEEGQPTDVASTAEQGLCGCMAESGGDEDGTLAASAPASEKDSTPSYVKATDHAGLRPWAAALIGSRIEEAHSPPLFLQFCSDLR